jgi:hypothetical protein
MALNASTPPSLPFLISQECLNDEKVKETGVQECLERKTMTLLSWELRDEK